MANGSLGRLPTVLKAENAVVVFGASSNAEVEFTPSFEATGVNFSNHSDNHVRIVMLVDAESVTILLPPNTSKQFNFVDATIGRITLQAIAAPISVPAGLFDLSAAVALSAVQTGYVDIDVIREQ